MPNPMPDLRAAVRKLKAQGFAIAITDFTFNRVAHFVLIKRYTGKKPDREQYALARIEFVPKSDTSNSKEWPANSAGLIGDTREIREFFQIPYAEGQVGDALRNLYEHLGAALLANIRMQPRPEEQAMLTSRLSAADSEDPERVYCKAS